jgi:hypothetical protein
MVERDRLAADGVSDRQVAVAALEPYAREIVAPSMDGIGAASRRTRGAA